MKNPRAFLITVPLAAILFLASCAQQDRSNAESTAVQGAPAASSADTAADAGITGGDITSPDRKIKKTADMRCRVEDVFLSTTHIENTVKAAGGVVADSRMDNEPEVTRTLPFSRDSLRQVQSYTTTAHLVLRVPAQAVDSVLADIAGQSAFINNRHLQLQDVTLQYLGNDLKGQAEAGNGAAGHAQSLARSSRDAVAAGEYADQRDAAGINRKLENLSLLAEVRYATLQVDLYQPERIDAIVIANTGTLMTPTAPQRLKGALLAGWGLLQDCLLGLLSIWPLLPVAAGVMILWRRAKRRKGVAFAGE